MTERELHLVIGGVGTVCVCVLCMQATPGPAGHPNGVLCPSGMGPGLLRAS